MGKPTGFIEFKRQKTKEQQPLERVRHFEEYALRLEDRDLQTQGARCMDCGTPFCHMGIEIRGTAAGCPIHNVIPEWNDLVYRGKWQEALDRLHLTNNFPEFTGRVCPAPCESSCVLGINEPAVAIKSIERSIIDKGFEEGWVVPRIPRQRTGKSVAIVGSGPAGLAAADQLNQQGHHVTVYERADRAGGLLMYGIPNMKLEKEIIERRVRLLQQEGIDIVYNVEIGVTMTADELRVKHDAVLLATGAQQQRALRIEGAEHNGVVLAMDYLTSVTKSYMQSNFDDGQAINVAGKHVIVIGGGDTGADCVATAIRQNCKSVVQFGKHPKLSNTRTEETMWPKDPNTFTFDYAYEEVDAKLGRDPREYCIHTEKIVADEQGNIKELHTIYMEKILGEDGFHYFKELAGTEKIWPVDYIFVAIGFDGVERELPQQMGVGLINNRIAATIKDYQTTVPGVFTAGDARRGQSLVVWAIKEGREAANAIATFLATTTITA